MRTHKNKSLYDRDFYKWSNEQVNLLKKGEFSKVDLENVIEEIESLGNSEKNGLYNSLVSLLQHMLKTQFTPQKKGNSNSWEGTILVSRRTIIKLIKKNPSFKKEIKKIFEEAYIDARGLAAVESFLDTSAFPEESPWTIQEVLGE